MVERIELYALQVNDINSKKITNSLNQEPNTSALLLYLKPKYQK